MLTCSSDRRQMVTFVSTAEPVQVWESGMFLFFSLFYQGVNTVLWVLTLLKAPHYNSLNRLFCLCSSDWKDTSSGFEANKSEIFKTKYSHDEGKDNGNISLQLLPDSTLLWMRKNAMNHRFNTLFFPHSLGGNLICSWLLKKNSLIGRLLEICKVKLSN